LKDGEDNVAGAAAEYLGKKKHQAAIPALIERMEKGGFWVKYGCLRALGEIGHPAAGEAVLRLAGEPDLRKAALEALGRMGVPEAEPFVLEGLFSEDRGLRKIAVLAFAGLEERMRAEGKDAASLRLNMRKNAGESLVAYLEELLGHENPELRSASMSVLGAAAGKDAVEPLLRTLPGLAEEEQNAVARVLEAFPDEDLSALIPRLRDDEASVRRWLAVVLGRRGVKGAVPHLVGLLEDENGHVRSEAARALGEIGEAIAVAPLVSLLSDPYPDVRQAGVEALRSLGEVGEEARGLVLSFLESHLDSPDQEMVANGLRIVAGLGSREVMDRLKFALKDDRSRVRRAAVEALGQLRGPEAVDILRLALTDEDAAVRREAVQKLGECEQPETLDFVIPMMQDDDLWVRVRAVQAVAGHRNEFARKILLAAVEQGEPGPVRLAAIRALGQAGAETGRGVLLSLAKTGDRESRMAAIESLGALGGRESLDMLLACLGDDDWSLRSAAVRALAASTGDEEVRRSLESVAQKDSDPMVRKSAADALGSTAV
jgi:HEAT repeat protein